MLAKKKWKNFLIFSSAFSISSNRRVARFYQFAVLIILLISSHSKMARQEHIAVSFTAKSMMRNCRSFAHSPSSRALRRSLPRRMVTVKFTSYQSSSTLKLTEFPLSHSTFLLSWRSNGVREEKKMKNMKGQRCMFDDKTFCQEGYCEDCQIFFRYQKEFVVE